MFTSVYLSLPLFTRACLPMLTHVHLSLLMLTLFFYLCSTLFTTRVYLGIVMFTYVNSYLPMFKTLIVPFLFMYTYVYSCLPIVTTHITRACLRMFTYSYWCIPMFTLL